MDTISRMARLEQKVENIENGINRIEMALIKHIDRESEIEKRFAGKWVEKAFIGVLLLMVAAFFGYIYK